MKFIWYNPDLDAYEKGTEQVYKDRCSNSVNADRFDVLYEFEEPSDKLIDKILKSLNMVRGAAVPTN